MSRSLILTFIGALAVSAITGIVGWNFAHVIEESHLVDKCINSDFWQDKQIEDLTVRLRALEVWQYNVNSKGKSP